MNHIEIKTLSDKKKMELHFRKNINFNIYSIGDLDDFFWEFTQWYALSKNNIIDQIALLYSGAVLPTFIAITEKDLRSLYELVEKIRNRLPEKFYAHLSEDIINVFGKENIIDNYGKHFKMALLRKHLLIKENDNNIKRLDKNDLEKIKKLYETSYPDNFFDERMLATGKYFGYYDNKNLAGVAGIHVYSVKYKVAALGNIAILPEYRGRSIGKRLTSELCNDLLNTVDNIGLNVSSENHQAISCYKKIGFEIIGEYEEYLLQNKK